MNKIELIKKLITDISNNEKYKGAIYNVDDCFFVIENDIIYISEEIHYDVCNFIPEEVEYVKQAKEELDLDDFIFRREGFNLEDLLECYYDSEDEESALQVEKLLDFLADEKSLFHGREDYFVHILNRLDLKNGEKYVYREPDEETLRYTDDIEPYWSEVPLYDAILDEYYYLINPDCWDEDDEDDEELEHWIKVLTEIDKYTLE